MPGKRTPADPREISTNANDSNPKQAGIQRPLQHQVSGGQWEPSEAPAEGAYREKSHTDH